MNHNQLLIEKTPNFNACFMSNLASQLSVHFVGQHKMKMSIWILGSQKRSKYIQNVIHTTVMYKVKKIFFYLLFLFYFWTKIKTFWAQTHSRVKWIGHFHFFPWENNDLEFSGWGRGVGVWIAENSNSMLIPCLN